MEVLPIMAKTLTDKNGKEIGLNAHVIVPSGERTKRPHAEWTGFCSADNSGVVKAGGTDEVCVEVYESRRYWFRPDDVEVIEPGADPELSPGAFDRTGVFGEILDERTRQDAKWGGPEHDDRHRLSDWNGFIAGLNRKGENTLYMGNPGGWRRRMVQVAALAVAALESLDRQAAASADFAEAKPHVLVGLKAESNRSGDAAPLVVVLDEADVPEIMPQFPPTPGMPEVKGL